MAIALETKAEIPKDAGNAIVGEIRIAIEGVSYEFYKQFRPVRLNSQKS